MRTSKYWLVRIRIIRPSGTTCLFADCCVSELALSNSSKACWSTTKQTSLSSWSKWNLVSSWYVIYRICLIHVLIQNISVKMLLSYELRICVYLLFIVQLITGKQNKEVTMIWLNLMEYMCPNWSSVCSFCLGTNPNIWSPDS